MVRLLKTLNEGLQGASQVTLIVAGSWFVVRRLGKTSFSALLLPLCMPLGRVSAVRVGQPAAIATFFNLAS